MIQPGKKDIIDREQVNFKIDILAITETHMRGSGFYTTPSGNTTYFSGPENESRNGVALSVTPSMNRVILDYNPVSDRILTAKINTKPCRLNIVIVYAPMSASSDEEIDAFYKQLEDVVTNLPNRDITLVMSDLNAKIGLTKDENHLRDVVGKFGLGDRNSRGEKWIQFCAENSLTVMNTCFEQHPRRLYTWVSPGDRARNQIDYIAIARRWRPCISSTKTYPGADCVSDHKLLVAEMTAKLRNCKRTIHKPQKRLSHRELEAFEDRVSHKFKNYRLDQKQTADISWDKFKNIITTSREKARGGLSDEPKKHWITVDTWNAIKERKMLLEGDIDCNDTD